MYDSSPASGRHTAARPMTTTCLRISDPSPSVSLANTMRAIPRNTRPMPFPTTISVISALSDVTRTSKTSGSTVATARTEIPNT